jgi:hypothetical protein
MVPAGTGKSRAVAIRRGSPLFHRRWITGALWVSASESFRKHKLTDILESNTEPNFSGIGHGSCVFS